MTARIALSIGAAGVMLALTAVLAVVGGSSPALAAEGGLGTGLRPGSVPAAYEQLVLAAGAVCAAAPPSIIAAQIQQ